MGKPQPEESAAKLEQYKADKEKIKKDAEELESSSEEPLRVHVIFSRSVTIFQIAIAISAIAILTRRKLMWYLSMLLAIGACYFFVMGFMTH